MKAAASLAKDLLKIMNARNSKKPSPYDTEAEVKSIDGETAWVEIPGSNDLTPVKKTINASVGDKVKVRVSGGKAWIAGNTTAPPTDNRVADVAVDMARGAGDVARIAREAADAAEAEAQRAKEITDQLDIDVRAVEERLDAAEDDIETLEGDISTVEGQLSNVQNRVTTAEGNITDIEGDITTLGGRVSTAEDNITDIEGDITNLGNRVSDAEDDVEDVLKGLALAEDVVGTLAWITAHSSVTDDTTPQSGKNYYIKNPDDSFVIVTDTTGKNPHAEGWYEIDEALQNYILSHLALTNDGLYVMKDNSEWKVLIKNDGIDIIDGTGGVTKIVSSYGSNIRLIGSAAELRLASNSLALLSSLTSENSRYFSIDMMNGPNGLMSLWNTMPASLDTRVGLFNHIVDIISCVYSDGTEVEYTIDTDGYHIDIENRKELELTINYYTDTPVLNFTLGSRKEGLKGANSVVIGSECLCATGPGYVFGQGNSILFGANCLVAGGYLNEISQSESRQGSTTSQSVILGGYSHKLQSQNSAIIAGYTNTINGDGTHAIVAGYNNVIDGRNTWRAVIIGGNTNTICTEDDTDEAYNSAIIAGYRNKLTAINSAMIAGTGNSVKGISDRVVMISGYENEIGNNEGVSTRGSIIFGGYQNKIPKGYNNTIINGEHNTINDAFESTIISGMSCTVLANIALAMGRETIAQGCGQVVFGFYNIAQGTKDSWGLSDQVLIVGNGSATARRNAMTLTYGGDMTIMGHLTQSSDRRLKEHINYLDENEDAIEFIRNLKPSHFIKDDQHHVGFYAQDVEAEDKWDCMTGEMNNYKTLSYTEIIAPLVSYCQHLEKRVKELEDKLNV